VRRISDTAVWDAVAEAWDTWVDADIADYDIALTDAGGDYYVGSVPSVLVFGTAYRFIYYERAGAVPTTTDLLIGSEEGDWTGATLKPPVVPDVPGEDVEAADELNVISPPIHDLYGAELWRRKRAVAVRERSIAYLQMALRDTLGNPVDLTKYGFVNNDPNSPTAVPCGSSSSSGTPDTNGMLTIFRESALVEKYRWTATPTVYDAANGIVKVAIPAGVMNHTGIYLSEFGVIDANENLLWSNECYVYVLHSAWHLPGNRVYRGPPAIDDVRLSLRDSDPVENELLTNYDFDLSEIAFAATRAVQFWNDQPPHIATARYSTKNFPFREIWLKGIHLYLFELAEESYRRNFFTVSAGGVVTDDKNRHKEYNQVWQERLSAFREQVLWQKVQINLGRAYGTFSAGYPH